MVLAFLEKELHFLTFLQLMRIKVCAHHSTNGLAKPPKLALIGVNVMDMERNWIKSGVRETPEYNWSRAGVRMKWSWIGAGVELE